MFDLEPPKPTKEFHEAYKEIYGKGKKRNDTDVQKPIVDSLSLTALDVPPLKKELEPKKSFFSFLNKEKKITSEPAVIPSLTLGGSPKLSHSFSDKELSELDTLDLPPLKTPEKMHESFQSESKKPLFSFSEHNFDTGSLELPPLKISKPVMQKKSSPAQDKLDWDNLDLPLIKIESVPLSSPIPVFSSTPSTKETGIESFGDQFPTPGKKAPVYDFLAEIKHGKRHETQPVKKLSTSVPLSKSMFDELAFEKTTAQKGARDMQIAMEHEPFGQEDFFTEKSITPLASLKTSPLSKTSVHTYHESVQEHPQVQSFKSPAEFKSYMKQAKDYELKLKKLNVQSKKAQQEVVMLLNKQQLHDTQLTQKMKKIVLLEKNLQEKNQQEMKKISLMEQ
ncbi:MAG: hypothetical protein WC254_03855, partial [Candidatus Woesearchaeota archaeon]